jgi:galactokinase
MEAVSLMDVDGIAREFTRRFGKEPHIFSAPGRVNLIGEHTDYNDGFVLPLAIDRRTYVAYSRHESETLRIYSQTIREDVEVLIDEPGQEDGWWTYIAGMAKILRSEGHRISGGDILIDSEIPFGAGLSSSAALEVAAGLALTMGDIDGLDLARAGQRVENELIGVRSGIMDQFTSALARADNALLIDCRSLSFSLIPMKLDGVSVLVCDSRVKHELADSAYNERREQCEAGVKLIKQRYPQVVSLRDVEVDQLDPVSDILPDVIEKRCRHVVTENRRTLDAADALKAGDLGMVGELMYASHDSLRDDYEVSCEELDFLVDAARRSDGVFGSRMTGGGFGGCTVTLVETEKVNELTNQLAEKYEKRFGRECETFLVKPSQGAREESVSS